MNDKWHEIKDQLLKLQLPQEEIDPLTFLSPKEWHIENYNGREVLVVAEEIPMAVFVLLSIWMVKYIGQFLRYMKFISIVQIALSSFFVSAINI